MPSVEAIAQTATAIAQQLGIDKFDIYGSTVDETSVEVSEGEPKQVQSSNRSSVIVRVWNPQQTLGVTSTTDVDENGLALALKSAQEASFFGAKENIPDFSPEATKPTAEVTPKLGELATVDKLIENLLQSEKALLDAHPAIIGVPYNGLEQQDVNRFYLNSDGALRQEMRSYAAIYLYGRTEQAGKRPRGAGALKISHSLADLDIAGCVQEAADKTISHLDYQPIKSGKYTVVFSPKAFLSLLGAFSNLFNAQNILDNQSLSTPDSIGSAIASSLLSVADDALHPSNISTEIFDGEGTPTRRVPIISQGILRNFLHSSGTAKRLNTQPTGHASIGAKVGVSSHYYHVFSEQPTTSTSEVFSLDEAESVILIDSLQALHAGVNALQGSFSLPFDGWLVNRGQLTSIESATVAGDYLALLKAIAYLEPESEITPGGICPRVWVKDLAITGE
jgi:PmbA protein